ncbi:MAG: HAMP domain-containing histidine kinase [Acetatifactor sp.]|nr:HAMP domain-containing histidine kinase [Acetatifactor sp.]
MIPKLRKKFISITAAALFAVLLLVVGSINCIFIIQNTRLLSSHLDQLLRQYSADLPFNGIPGDGKIPGGSFQDFTPPNDPADGASFPQLPDEGLSDRKKPDGNFSLLPRFENRLRMRTDGCIILLDANGNIAAIRQDAAENYSEADLKDIVSHILDSGKTQGWRHYYKYRVMTRQTPTGSPETVIGLVNASSTLYSIFTMLSVSALIGILSFLVVLLIIIFASGRAVRPIAESYARQKQFVTDAGHELKTPLTVISANNELARMIYGSSEWFDSIDKQVSKMNGLVGSLITLAKMDEEQKPVFALFNLSDAVYDTAKSFENLIHTRGRLLTLDIAEDISYSGDESRLRQLVSILMDNAIKYCDDKGKIAVRFTADKSVCLQITNDYTGFEGFEPEKVFERFYRGDRARTPDGSFGLGLSIAKSIVELHRGIIRAKVLDHGRVQFEVVLPKGK